MTQRTAIFPGTFDPPNLGHIDVVQRAHKLFDRLYVAIGYNSNKPRAAFSPQERVELFKQATLDLPNVEIVSFNGLLVDYMDQRSITTIIRSIRSFSDFEYEMTLAYMNRQISGIETIYIIPDEKFKLISSSLIRDLARYGKRLDQFVPAVIEPLVFERLSAYKNQG